MQPQSSATTHRPDGTDAPAPVSPGASRRFFLAGSSAFALAATAGASTAWAHGAPDAAPSSDGVVDVDLQAGTVVAYIRPGESEVTVMSGDREVVVDDPALVRAITRTLGGR